MNLTNLFLASFVAFTTFNCCHAQEAQQALEAIGPPSTQLREEFKLDPFYQKVLLIEGFPIVASQKVSDAAIHEAANTVRNMLANRADILAALKQNRIRLAVMAVDERTTDLPEHADLTPADYWNRRARGLGATRARPAVSCAEENLLNLKGDPYATESILVHEFAHAIHVMGINAIDSSFDERLEVAYQSAMKRGLWKGLYAAENSGEYFVHNHVNTRQELQKYDPAVAKLCEEVFGDNDWRYVRSDAESRQKEKHLESLDRTKLPQFQWEEK